MLSTAVCPQLTRCSKAWEPVDLDIFAYKTTGTFVLKGADDIMTLLDDHIVLTQSMMFRYDKVLLSRVLFALRSE